MESIKQVVIGIQARSGSQRFPRKVFEMIGDKPMLRHVIDAADKSAFYINRYTYKKKINVSYAVVCPSHDEIRRAFNSCSMIIEGPEHDVLSRYMVLVDKLEPHYIVRITADCPLIPDYVITKHINTAVINQYDYYSNVDPRLRTSMDGWDVEVISRRALMWANENCNDPSMREHVTPILRTRAAEDQFICGTTVNYVDLSHIKLSVDTPEDLERVRQVYEKTNRSHKIATALFGNEHVHKL